MGFGQNILTFFGRAFTPPNGTGNGFLRNAGGSTDASRNLSNNIFPASFERPKIDLQTWADGIKEAEVAGWPYRIIMQTMYQKTILNPHVAACVQRRKELTLLRDFEIVNAAGEPDKTWTEYFKQAWYKQHVLELILDAQYFGYTLISIGGITNGVPDQIINIKRWNISPDRMSVSIFPKSPIGYKWEEEPYKDWHIWVPTPQTNGINNCGYGMLYVVAAMEILLRNNLSYNSDFIEMFAQPYRWLKTNDLEGEEFEAKKKMMREMASAGFGITGLSDELEFLTDGARGNGYKSYNDFDHRIKSDISKFIGGHADFVDSTTKNNVGGTQNTGGGDVTDDATGNSQVQKAIAAKRMIDGDFVTTITNETIIPKLRNLGINIPAGHKIHFLNDTEERAISAQVADKNQKWATLALTMAQGGLKMPAEFFKEMTGVEAEDAPIEPDKNVMKDPKEQAAGKGDLKDDSKKRVDKPKHT